MKKLLLTGLFLCGLSSNIVNAGLPDFLMALKIDDPSCVTVYENIGLAYDDAISALNSQKIIPEAFNLIKEDFIKLMVLIKDNKRNETCFLFNQIKGAINCWKPRAKRVGVTMCDQETQVYQEDLGIPRAMAASAAVPCSDENEWADEGDWTEVSTIFSKKSEELKAEIKGLKQSIQRLKKRLAYKPNIFGATQLKCKIDQKQYALCQKQLELMALTPDSVENS